MADVDVKRVFGQRKNAQRLIANERVRLKLLNAELDAHKAQHPELYQSLDIGVEPLPDRALTYAIPN